jgi:hypothetical protein
LTGTIRGISTFRKAFQRGSETGPLMFLIRTPQREGGWLGESSALVSDVQ